MKPEQIFVGDIRKCTKYEIHNFFCCETSINGTSIGRDGFGRVKIEHESFKDDAILIKIKNGGYVDLERLESVLDYIKIYKDIKKDGYKLGNLMMPGFSYRLDCLFVDESSLKPYYSEKQTKNISVRQLKKQVNNSK